MFTDDVGMKGNSIGSVRPSVCLSICPFVSLSFEPTDLWSWLCIYIGHGHSSPAIEWRRSRSEVKMRWSVGPRMRAVLVSYMEYICYERWYANVSLCVFRICWEQCLVTRVSVISTARAFRDFGASSAPLPGCIPTSATARELAW